MATSTSLRTIWITIRAVNYATNTFNQLIGQMAELQKKEAGIIQMNMNLAKSAMSAGILFQVLGQQIGGVAERFLNYGAYVMYAISALNLLQGVQKFVASGMLAHQVTVFGLTMSYQMLYLSIAAAVGVFMILYQVLSAMKNPVADAIAIIGGLIAVLIALIALEGAASMGLALVGIAAGAAGGLALAQQYGAFQMGTRMVGATGPAIVHHGEIIYNPATNRPTQVGTDLAREGGESNVWHVPITIENVHTKAEIDDVDEQMRKSLRKNMRGRK
jgi:branched-subunit amino acid transport protein AzlD